MNFCLNLCEILDPKVVNKVAVEDLIERALEDVRANKDTISRIYLGSSFCSQYFLNTITALDKIFEFCTEAGIPITLTLPIFSQKDLERAKQTVKTLLDRYDIIDEVTVNDLGMLSFMQKDPDHLVNLGRLFFKDARDIRVTDYYETIEQIPNTISLLENYGNFNAIELDQTNRTVDYSLVPDSVKVLSLHVPYAYMTTGNICKFASINKNDEHKFRPNARCGLECTYLHEFFTKTFKNSDIDRELFRLGRTVYFLNEDTEVLGREPDRFIYFPLKELALFGQEEDKKEV